MLVRSRSMQMKRAALVWMTRTTAARAHPLACLLLVRCNDEAPQRLAERTPVVPTRTITPQRLLTTLLLCLRSKTCLPALLLAPVFPR